MNGGTNHLCHVCSDQSATALYRDPHGNFLQCCDAYSCTYGYTYQFPIEVLHRMRRWFSSSKHAAAQRIPFPT
jgi:hypothetical protein